MIDMTEEGGIRPPRISPMEIDRLFAKELERDVRGENAPGYRPGWLTVWYREADEEVANE